MKQDTVRVTRRVALGVFALLVFVGAGAAYGVYAMPIPQFVDTLIAKGIIPQSQVTRAHEFVSLIERATVVGGATSTATATSSRALNADLVAVGVSQLIQHADLTFKEGSDIEGLLLIAKNTSQKDISLDVQSGCSITYKIFSATNTMLYDSATTPACVNAPHATYTLPVGRVRLFGLTHLEKGYHLAPGEYRFELTYPGYGSGDRTVTVTL